MSGRQSFFQIKLLNMSQMMFNPELDNKLALRKRRHIEAVIRKRLDYFAKELCVTHGTKLAKGSRWACSYCLESGKMRAKKYRERKKCLKS